MRQRPTFWLCVSLICFLGASYCWRLGDQWAAKPAPAGPPPAAPVPATARGAAVAVRGPFALLSRPGTLNSAPAAKGTNAPARKDYRLSNSTRSASELARSERAILLENASLDTTLPVNLAIPAHLRSQGDPGSYIVQASQHIDDRFRALLGAAGASWVSYIPNNACLVRASAAAAARLSAQTALVQTVIPFEPEYKLKGPLLGLAVEQTPLLPQAALNLLVFPDAREATLAELRRIGAAPVGETRSPFGTVFKVRPPANALPSLAGIPGVQEIELSLTRAPANDLSRPLSGVAADSVTSTNYLLLSGTNILVAIADSGVDTNHPDLTGRVKWDYPASGQDKNGHGTHVAGIIIGDGAQSGTITNPAAAQGSTLPVTNNQFRGVAPMAQLYSIQADPLFGPSYADDFSFGPAYSDAYLQETAALAGALIFNNSWNYSDLAYRSEYSSYDLSAASYDAAARDALPLVSGPQPVLFVFSAGDGGAGADDGTGGNAGSIESPGTSKNGITVGAYESSRGITNGTSIINTNFFTGAPETNISQPWMTESDNNQQVAAFSSRGNVGIGSEGDFGRFKPDVTAPGTFIISTASTEWDQQSYYGYHQRQHPTDVLLAPNGMFVGSLTLVDTAMALNVEVAHVRYTEPYPMQHAAGTPPGPNLSVFVSTTGAALPAYDYVGTNLLTVLSPPDTGTNYTYTVVNTSTQTVLVDIGVDLTYIPSGDNTFEVLSNLNGGLGTYYRYESGTSMSAGQVSGVLALMQEFLESPAHLPAPRTNFAGGPYGHSPALLKAMLINGARSMGNGYNFQVQNNINYQGWGKVSLPTSIHPGLANEAAPTNSMFIVDQDPNNSLATGDRHTYKIAIAPAGQGLPLKVTLVWTDPPGNPVAGLKLVNDLDLVVTNLDSVGTSYNLIYFGNDIVDVNDYNQPWDTNTVPNVDFVNNVENVFIPAPLATNYSITVVGHRVNVNAVSQGTNNTYQDYALVVSCGDGTVTNAMTFARAASTQSNLPDVTAMTNAFPGSDNYYGQTLGGQRVGASSPLLGTNQVAIPNSGGAVTTLGTTNQWHFYVITNDSSFTNARFVIANPIEVSVPRMGTESLFETNATPLVADADMYVSTDPTLLALNPQAVAGAYHVFGPTNSGSIVLSNAVQGVYYIGVQSQDQMAVEYTLQVLFSLLPPGGLDALGGHLPWGQWLAIPTGTPDRPGVTNAWLGPNLDPSMLVRRVIVTNYIAHQLMGDLAGIITYADGTFCVLNDHRPDYGVTNGFIYDDSNQGDIPGAIHSDGPGTLKTFAGRRLGGIFKVSEEDNTSPQVGNYLPAGIFLERQSPLIAGVTNTILPNHCTDDYIEVGPQVTAMTISASLLSGTGPLGLQICSLDGTVCTAEVTNSPGVSITLNQFSNPPLTPGTYDVKVCNLGPNVAKVFLIAFLTYGQTTIQTVTYATNPVTAIPDDAVSFTTLNITNHLTIESLDTGVLITNLARVSDLAITLISPGGERISLFQNRSGYNPDGIGTFTWQGGTLATGFSSTNLTPFYTNNFEDVAAGPYVPGALFDRWSVLTNTAWIYPTLPAPWLSNNILLVGYGVLSNSLPVTNATVLPGPLTSVTSYQLSFRATHSPYLAGLVGWWPFDLNPSDIFGGLNGLPYGNVHYTSATGMVNQAYFGDGELARVVVPRAPVLDVGNSPYGFSIQGWVRPANVTDPAPLVEWYDPTNTAPLGFQFWLGDLSSTNPAPGGVSAAFYSTNPQPAFLAFTNSFLTNSGWQHLALTYDGSSGQATLYTNGQLAVAQFLALTNATPRAVGDLYFGYDPAPVPTFTYTNFSSLTNLKLLRAATAAGSALRLTPAAANTNGSAYHLGLLNLTAGFSTAFQFQISGAGSSNDIAGGQGLSFWVASSGVQGTPGVLGAPNNSLAVCFVTSTNLGVATNNYLAVTTNGTHWLARVELSTAGINLRDGRPHPTQVEYVGGALTVIVDNVPLISGRAVDLTGILNQAGEAFAGFGASTDDAWENHDILNWRFSAGVPDPGTSYAGGLDEWTVFSRPLTPCEVLAIYQAGTNGMYGTNVLWCPLTNTPGGASMTLQFPGAIGAPAFTFTNGLAWTNGPVWETNTLSYSNFVYLATTNGPATNVTGLVLTNCDPNLALDDFVLSAVTTTYYSGTMDFNDETNLTVLPIKYAPAPYVVSNTTSSLVFLNNFESAPPGVYGAGTVIPGAGGTQAWHWTAAGGSVSVVSNSLMATTGTNFVVLGMNAVQCSIPTTPGQLYQLSYGVRGPAAVSWWTGDIEPLSQRAWDLLGGNHAAFVDGATNTADAYVGAVSLELPGIPATNGTVSKLEIGDPANLRFTNSFSIEAWIQPYVRSNFLNAANEQILFRGEASPCRYPYYFALQRYSAGTMDVVFHLQDDIHGDCGATLQTITEPVKAGEWQHVAVVFETGVVALNGGVVLTNNGVVSTNSLGGLTNEMRIYYNGVQQTPAAHQVAIFDELAGTGPVATEYTPRFPMGALDPALSPGVSIGARSRYDFSEPFSGEINDLTAYGRALTGEEIREIYQRGVLGKADRTVAPAFSLAELSVTIGGGQNQVVYGNNAQWASQTMTFTAVETNTTVLLQGMLPGTLVDGLALTTTPTALNYEPEQSLAALYGSDAYGVWTLEIQDAYAGPGTVPTNLLAQLAQWQLNFQTFPTVVPPVIQLEHGIPYTNSIVANGYQNFIVQVPQWATNATNVLLLATDLTGTNPLPVGVLCDTNTFPVTITNALVWPPANAPVTNILTTNLPPVAGYVGPVLQPGTSYFLTVTNTNSVAVTFALGVWYDIVTLTNCEPLTNGMVGPAGIPRYYQFDIPTNGPAGGPAATVAFYLGGVVSNYTGLGSNLTVVLSEHLPLPDLAHFDYISFAPRTNDDVFMLVTNTTPFPIQTNRWYVGIFNSAPTNVPFVVQACYTTNALTFITLTNGVDYTASATANTVFLAPPGPPEWFFFRYTVTNYIDAMIFDLYDLSGQADLVLQRDVPPTMAPYFAASTQPGTVPEQIVVRTSGTLPDLRGDWYLGVYSHEPINPVAYTLRGSAIFNGLLLSALPVVMTNQVFQTNFLLLTWNAVVGDYYTITLNTLGGPIAWTNVLAATPVASAVVPMPTNGTYSVAPVATPTTLRPPLYIAAFSTNELRLSWPTAFTGFTLQFTTTLNPTSWANVTLPVTIEGGYYVVYVPLPAQATYYRLIQ